MAVFDDGTGAGLYLAGAFHHADDLPVERIVRWDGQTWSALASGLDREVTSLVVFDDGTGPALYAGGAFTAAGGTGAVSVARWNGTSWSPVGAGFDDVVLTLAVHDFGSGPQLYAGGTFVHAGTTLTRHLARWTGANWIEVGGGTNAPVDALTSHQGALAVGGEFSTAGPIAAARVALWDGTSWAALGQGVGAAVLSLASFDDGSGLALYAGGEFGLAGGQPANRIARWNGMGWQPLGVGADGPVRVLFARPGVGLLVGGDFLSAGGLNTYSLAIWNSGSWSLASPNGGGNGGIRAITTFDYGAGSELTVGGRFFYVGLPTMGLNVTRLSGGAWWPIGTGLGVSGPLQPITGMLSWTGGPAALDGLYVTGSLIAAGQTRVQKIARFDGNHWNSVGGGFTGPGLPLALAKFDDGNGPCLYIGGDFIGAAGTYSTVVRWDGVQYQTVGAWPNGKVVALAVHDDGSGPGLYAAGEFTAAGGISALRVARWDGSTWHSVGSGVPARVHALGVYDDGHGARLFAGTEAPGVVYSWDGGNWTPIASSFGSSVSFEPVAVDAFSVFDAGSGPELIAGGAFDSPFSRVARWNGTSWSSLGPGLGPINGTVDALQVWDAGDGGGPALYAFGNFQSIGGGTVSPYITAWSDGVWRPFLPGLNAPARATVVQGRDLWMGGGFSSAGGLESYVVARRIGCGSVRSFCAGDGIDEYVSTPCPCGNYGGAGRGCGWHAGPNGASLEASGTVSPDALVLSASGMPLTAPSTIFLKGDALIAGGIPFGDGVRCIGGTLIRLGAKTNVGGAAQYPEAGNVPISVRGATPPGSGVVGYYQTYFRNAAAFCTPSTFNVTNAVRVQW